MKLPDKPDEYEILANRNLANILRDRLSKLKNEQCQFILCLENCRNLEIHHLFKQIAYNELGKSFFFDDVIHELFLYSGLVTQCAKFATIQRMPNLRNYCNNLLQSVNTKLDGENKQIAQLRTSIKTMFVGADVQHTKNNYSGNLPSIATVVASMNSECTSTNQRASRQWPNKGKQSEEAILLLKDMIEELLREFKENNDGALPEHIVFYRDGVDDGQFERVQNEEVTALKKAFQSKK
jgi:eukaryotic translation initiation factor 2C